MHKFRCQLEANTWIIYIIIIFSYFPILSIVKPHRLSPIQQANCAYASQSVKCQKGVKSQKTSNRILCSALLYTCQHVSYRSAWRKASVQHEGLLQWEFMIWQKPAPLIRPIRMRHNEMCDRENRVQDWQRRYCRVDYASHLLPGGETCHPYEPFAATLYVHKICEGKTLSISM